MPTDICFSHGLLCLWTLALLISSHVSFVSPRLSEDVPTLLTLPTVTVRGFLNFKTTVDGTVIVFTPASDVQSDKPTDPPQFSTNAILHSNALDSSDGIENIQDLAYSQPARLDLIKPHGDLNHQVHREKESFQHISDNAVLPSIVQTNNDLETDAKQDIRPLHQYPTGLVTVLGGTHIEQGSTTVFETKVIGTYIDGKYAQILQSTSKIIAPTSFLSPHNEETIPTSFNKDSETTRTSSLSIAHSETMKEVLPSSSGPIQIFSQGSSYAAPSTETSSDAQVISSRLDVSNFNQPLLTSAFKEDEELPMTRKVEQVSTMSQNLIQSSFITPELTPSYKELRPTQTLESAKTSTFVKTTRLQPVTSLRRSNFEEDNTVVSQNRNLRSSSTRIRFVAPKRPSQTVILNRFKVKLTVRQNSSDDFELTTVPDDEQSEEDTTRELEEDHPQEVTSVDADPAQMVFQETTITSEVTLHVGRRKSVRTLTITTSVPVRIDPSDVDHPLRTIDAQIFNITEGREHGDEESSDHSVVTRTFTTTERTLKTSLLPIFDGVGTSYHTVTESFFIMKIITAYRTLPPGDITVLEDITDVPVEMTPTLDTAADVQSSVLTSGPPQKEQKQSSQTSEEQETQLHSSIVLPEASSGHISSHLSNPLLSLGAALSNNPLAAVYLGLQQLNAQMTLYSTITEVSTLTTTDTIYSTKTIRFYDGRSTRFRTISDPVTTKRRTVTTTVTSVQPFINTQALQQQQQLQKLIVATQLSPPRPQVSTVTSVYTTVTTATSLSTRIYTLIYNGFSTKFRTVTSSRLYPTTFAVTSTKEMPISPTQPPSVPFAYPYPA